MLGYKETALLPPPGIFEHRKISKKLRKILKNASGEAPRRKYLREKGVLPRCGVETPMQNLN